MSGAIEDALPEPQSALARALLLGIRGDLPRDVTDEFRSTGTSHLLAISGLHVGVVLALVLGAATWLLGRRRHLYLLAPLAAVWGYALVSGLSPSVERAAIMATVYLAALALGRPRSALPALALAAAVMAGVTPSALRDVSFQLSFTAMTGIALLVSHWPALWSETLIPFAGRRAWWSPPLRGLLMALVVSATVTLATLPLIAFNFHRVPILGIPATVLALPAIPLILLTSVTAGLGAFVHPLLGEVLGWLAWVPLEYLLRLVDLFARVPGSNITVPAFSAGLVWVYYVPIALLVLLPRGVRSLRDMYLAIPSTVGSLTFTTTIPWWLRSISSGKHLVAGLGLAFLASLFWYHAVTGPDGRLHVYFLDVGQGDGALIVTPQGNQVLVDGGPHSLSAVRAVGDLLPFGDRDLDMVLLTHPDEDHFRGLLQVLERYRVELVAESGTPSDNPLFIEWSRLVEEEITRRVVLRQGDSAVLGGDTLLEVLNPPSDPLGVSGSSPNNNGIVLRLTYGDVAFLLAADLEADGERRLVREGLPLRSHVLKVAHHGSAASTTAEFLTVVSPVAAVVSAGAGNPYGHPRAGVLERLHDGVGEGRTFVTAENGDVEFITDGRRLWVRTER